MQQAEVIIGANLGDEGKGLITDFRAAPHGSDAVVVRFNGGAQAGHTVETQDGKRHIFSHFGSGTLAGAGTFLSRFFISNPLLFIREHKTLTHLGLTPVAHADAHSPVTTPYDMMINQIVEESRGNARHGSCGLGIGETLERNAHSDMAVYCRDLADTAGLKTKLRTIRDHWLPKRLEKLGASTLSPEWKERVSNDAILSRFLDDVDFFRTHIRSTPPDFLGAEKRKIIFEGAQGLLLDQDRGWFPYVTRSNTGIKNVLALAEEAKIDHLNVTYITRAYATRHGAGPLPHELPQAPFAKIEDKTNVTNPWQGTIRYGWLDADLLSRTIKMDLSDRRSSVSLTHGLAVTCLDQIDGEAVYIEDDIRKGASHDMFLQTLAKMAGAQFLLASTGPSRNFVAAV